MTARRSWLILAAVSAAALLTGCQSIPPPAPLSLTPLPLPVDLVAVSDMKPVSLDGLAAGSAEAQARQIRTATQLELPLEVTARKSGIRLRLLPPGSFAMGSPWNENGRDRDEARHEVTLSLPFYMGRFEITQEQWQLVMGGNPARFRKGGPASPMDAINPLQADAFCRKLCELEGVPTGTYRLPTEAEWEYACRAGTTTPFCHGATLTRSMAQQARVSYEKGASPTAVGSFNPNAWGLHDMHGNVWEWCSDWYTETYPRQPRTNPAGPASGAYRVGRGGGWGIDASFCRSANRGWAKPDVADLDAHGLRIVRSLFVTP